MKKLWKRLWRVDKVDEYINWRSWEKWQVVSLFLVLVIFGRLFYLNMDEALVKADDWERKEQAKRAYNALEKDYLRLVKVFPPNNDIYGLRGCGDAYCPINNGEGSNCIWASDKPGIDFQCGGKKWFDVAPIPDNKDTKGADRVKYKRLNLVEAVVEVCLQREKDPEAISVLKSKIGWTKDDCPSGAILIWPDKYQN